MFIGDINTELPTTAVKHIELIFDSGSNSDAKVMALKIETCLSKYFDINSMFCNVYIF